MQNLGGGLVLMLMRAGIMVGGVVVVVVEVMVMVEVGVVSFSEGRCLPVVEVECVVVGCRPVRGDVLNFGGGFVAAAVVVVVVVVVVEMVVGGSKVEVVAVVRIVCSSVNGELYSLWCLSQKFWRGRCVVMRADSLMECCLWEVTVQ